MKPLFYAAAALPLTALLAGCCADEKGDTQKPNIIFLYADDLGIGDLSCYGATEIQTPNIDRLAAQGIRFTNAYATSATSTPSRFGLLTGMYPWRQENTGIAPGNSELIIDTACYTLADALHDNGYHTGAVGKWHLGLGPKGGTDFNKEIHPGARDIGFDYEFIIPATVDRVPCVFVEDSHVVGLDPNDPITVDYNHKVGDWPTGEENPELVKMKPSQGHNNTIINGIPRIGWMTGGRAALWVDEDIADNIVEKASNFITKHKDEPFFLYMGTNDVHVPRIPHPRFAGKSKMGVRGDVILQLDWTIGAIMDKLEELGIAENTLFIFTSDNGPVIDDGYADQARELLGNHTPMGIYRGGKYSLYEAGTRIPMMLRWPKRVAAGQTQEAQFSQVDVYRSLAELTGATLPEGAAPDSQNRIEVLLGESHESRECIVEQNLNNTLAIIEGEWKYLEPSDKRPLEFWTKTELGHNPEGELYNIKEDAREQHNVLKEHPEIGERLAKKLQAIKDAHQSTRK